MDSEAQPKFPSQAFQLIYRVDAFSHPALKAPDCFFVFFLQSVSCLHNSTNSVSIHYSVFSSFSFFFSIFPHVTLPRFLSFTSSSIRSPPLPLTASIITRCISISFTLGFFFLSTCFHFPAHFHSITFTLPPGAIFHLLTFSSTVFPAVSTVLLASG